MAAKQIKFESFGEMIYYLFKKKTCPVCGSTLKKFKQEKKQGFQCWRWGLSEVKFGNLNTITINYYCSKCKNMRSLSEIYDMQKD